MKNTEKIVNFQRTILTEQTLSHRLDSPAEDRLSESAAIPAWIDQELLDEAYRVWLKEFGKVLTQAEAVEILENLRQFTEVLLKASANKARAAVNNN